MMDLSHVSDEDNVELFFIIAVLLEQLSETNYTNNIIVYKANRVLEACVLALAKGSDNTEIVEKLKTALEKQAGMAE